jgi:hypothetical protein
VRKTKPRISTFILILAIFSWCFTGSAQSAGPSPRFNVGCFDDSTSGIDSGGKFVEYKPSVSANFYGKKATIRTYLNEVLTSTLRISRDSKSFSRLERFDLKVKIYRSQVSLGKNEFKFVFRDSKNKGSTWICETQLYEGSFGKELSVGSGGGGTYSSGISGCQLNGKKLYGSVYFTDSSYLADFSVFVANSSYLADLRVYLTSSSYLANSCGIWYPTNSSYLADFSVYLTTSSYLADFTIYQTQSSYLAGT